jgi:hypothetical protein
MVTVDGAARGGREGLLPKLLKHTDGGKYSDIWTTDLVQELIKFKWQT